MAEPAKVGRVIAGAEVAFDESFESLEFDDVGIGVVIDDIELRVIPGQTESQGMAAFHPVQRGSIFPLVLEHARIAETGAGSELELIADGRIGDMDFDLRKRSGAAREIDPELARRESWLVFE